MPDIDDRTFVALRRELEIIGPKIDDLMNRSRRAAVGEQTWTPEDHRLLDELLGGGKGPEFGLPPDPPGRPPDRCPYCGARCTYRREEEERVPAPHWHHGAYACETAMVVRRGRRTVVQSKWCRRQVAHVRDSA